MNIFITGGTSGIGLALAGLFLAEQKHKIAVCSFESADEARAKIPAELIYYQADVTDTGRMKEVIESFNQKAGQLDLVIANAGISMPKAAIPDFDRGRKLIEINVIGVLNTFEPAIKIMKEQKSGHLVALGSIAGTNGLPGTAIYGASKAAVLNLCEAFEIDLYKYGIHVTALAPGFIATPLTAANDHKMPFLMSTEQAAALIKKAIIQKKGFYVFPFSMNIISRCLYHLPRSLYKAFMKYDPLNLSHK